MLSFDFLPTVIPIILPNAVRFATRPDVRSVPAMTARMKRLILELLGSHKKMTIATVRPDGYPQATTVVYANDGLTIYFVCDPDSQKVRNLKRSGKVSLTIDSDKDAEDWQHLKGLSMGALARVATDKTEIRRGLDLLVQKFPDMGDDEELEGGAVVRVVPKVISVIDYERGFGHTDLLQV